jgi:hypothetical protein
MCRREQHQKLDPEDEEMVCHGPREGAAAAGARDVSTGQTGRSARPHLELRPTQRASRVAASGGARRPPAE